MELKPYTALLAVLAAVIWTPDAPAEVIASQSGAIVVNWDNPALAVSWTSTEAFADVSISAVLSGPKDVAPVGTVYLMDAIGPGTTTANEIAKIVVGPLPEPSFSTPPTLLFTGLNLEAGTYFLVAASDVAGPAVDSPPDTVPRDSADTEVDAETPMVLWAGARDAVVETTAPDVTIGPEFAASILADYAPASSFFEPSEVLGLLFEVTGRRAEAVTEPGTLSLLGVVAFLALTRRRRKAA